MNKLISYYLVVFFLVIFYTSCKKTEEIIKPPAPDFNKPNKGCLVTKTGDTLGFGAYNLDFTYDSKGNPETFAGVLKITYDAKGRLYRQLNNVNSDKNYVQWDYPDDNSFLPESSNSYLNGILTATSIFSYDDLGRLVKSDRIYVNGYAAGEYIWKYAYDTKNNVQTIIQEGIATPIFQAKTYDDKPNFTNANQWIKYILDDPGSGYILLNYSLFSANNATQWLIADKAVGFDTPLTVDCIYKYNPTDFVIKDSIVFRDPVNGDFSDVQSNLFKCQ